MVPSSKLIFSANVKIEAKGCVHICLQVEGLHRTDNSDGGHQDSRIYCEATKAFGSDV